jgi:hypothetical protein
MPEDEARDRIRLIDAQLRANESSWPSGARTLAIAGGLTGAVLVGTGVGLQAVDRHSQTDFHILGAVGLLSIILGVVVTAGCLFAAAIWGHAHASDSDDEKERLLRERERLREQLTSHSARGSDHAPRWTS